MSLRWLFAILGVLAALAGVALWLGNVPAGPRISPTQVSAAALYAATFRDTRGQAQALGRFQGQPLVLNFWATWCAPCREEMPALSALQGKWAGRVQFVGIAHDEPARVESFGRELRIGYPLLVGADEVDELARRLGNGDSVLPFTVLVDAQGRVRRQKVGPYTERELDAELRGLLGG